MTDWKTHSLAEVYDFASGLSKPRSEFGSGFPFLSFKDVFYNRFVPEKLDNLVQSNQSERNKCSIKRGDVFLTRTSETMDELGMSCVSLSDMPDATFNGFTKRLRPKDEDYILPEYAGYFFSSPRFRTSVNAMSTMSTRASLNNDMLSSLEIAVPELDVQKKIANVLKPLDDRIELNRRMNETLEEMARALFRDWFVDFGPTRRQMQGATDPAAIMGHAFPAEKASAVAPLFPAKLGENTLPEGWEERPLEAFVEIIGGGTPKTKVAEYWGGTIPWFSVVDAPSNGDVYVLSTEKCITPAGLASSSARMVPEGTTIISARGTVGKIGMAPHDMTFNQSCYALRPKAPVGERFVYLATERLVERLQAMAHGSVFSTITRSTFASLNFAGADPKTFAAFEEVTDGIFAKIKANGQENQTLAVLRDLLLPKLMSGEIRLKDAEASA